MSEEKTVSKPRQLWDSAVKAVKGGGTEQLIETFTAEMTLVAEGLCEDQNNLRREITQVRTLAGIIAGAWVIVTVLNLFQ